MRAPPFVVLLLFGVLLSVLLFAAPSSAASTRSLFASLAKKPTTASPTPQPPTTSPVVQTVTPACGTDPTTPPASPDVCHFVLDDPATTACVPLVSPVPSDACGSVPGSQLRSFECQCAVFSPPGTPFAIANSVCSGTDSLGLGLAFHPSDPYSTPCAYTDVRSCSQPLSCTWSDTTPSGKCDALAAVCGPSFGTKVHEYTCNCGSPAVPAADPTVCGTKPVFQESCTLPQTTPCDTTITPVVCDWFEEVASETPPCVASGTQPSCGPGQGLMAQSYTCKCNGAAAADSACTPPKPPSTRFCPYTGNPPCVQDDAFCNWKPVATQCPSCGPALKTHSYECWCGGDSASLTVKKADSVCKAILGAAPACWSENCAIPNCAHSCVAKPCSGKTLTSSSSGSQIDGVLASFTDVPSDLTGTSVHLDLTFPTPPTPGSSGDIRAVFINFPPLGTINDYTKDPYSCVVTATDSNNNMLTVAPVTTNDLELGNSCPILKSKSAADLSFSLGSDSVHGTTSTVHILIDCADTMPFPSGVSSMFALSVGATVGVRIKTVVGVNEGGSATQSLKLTCTVQP